MRPISLLNVDYKITTKALANRVKKVLPKIIHNSQTGFLKGRYIGENIRLLFELLEHFEEQNIPGMIFFSDFEKAFDSIDRDSLIKCLRYFNFEGSFINWIKLFYSNAKSCVSNNGHHSEFFPIQRGVRQGCPLSPYLFIIGIELLANQITTKENIKGITLAGSELKITCYADDASFILDGTQKSFETLIDVLENFRNVSKKFHSFEKLKELHNVPNEDFLKYLSLVQSIPKYWKTQLKQENGLIPIKSKMIDTLLQVKQTNKFAYKLLTQSENNEEDKSQQKWNTTFINEDLNWKKIYTIPIIATKDMKIREFQYKCLKRIIPSNVFLHKCKLVSSSLCDFCQMEIETVNHMFWECVYVQTFWMKLKDCLNENQITINITFKTTTFGIQATFTNENKLKKCYNSSC